MTFLVAFGIQLAMYGTPVIYPMSAIPARYSWLIRLNPMTAPIESFRAAFLGGHIPWMDLGLSAVITAALLLFGVILFNKVEKTFMDTV
jgi:lipopolysaccharide transport system permease protein